MSLDVASRCCGGEDTKIAVWYNLVSVRCTKDKVLVQNININDAGV